MATIEEITERYPQFASFFNHPELGPLLQYAAGAGATPVELQAALHKTEWWNKTWADARQLEVLKGTDPAEYNQRRTQARYEVESLFKELGITTKDHPWLPEAVTDEWLKRGKDDWFLFAEIGRMLENDHSLLTSEGSMGARVASYKALAHDYLLDYDDTALTKMAIGEWRKQDSREAIENRMRQQAIRSYGHMQDELERGMTVRQLASPMINQIARTLEINPDDVDLSDPKFRQLVDYTDTDTGKRRMMTLTEAERFARRQESFQHTKGARDEGYQMANALLKEMGAVR